MRRSAPRRTLASFALFAALGVATLAPSACDATLNLGVLADGGGGLESGPFAGGDSGPATCASVCDKAITCGVPNVPQPRSACIASCQQEQASQALLDCVASAPCASLEERCRALLPKGDAASEVDSGIEVGFDVQICQDACSTLLTFDCISPAEQSTCRDFCVTSAKRTAFHACVDAVGSDCARGQGCLRVFEGD